MENRGIAEPLAQANFPLQCGESIQSCLKLQTLNNKNGPSPKQGWLVLTNQRLMHIHDGVAEAEIQSMELCDVGAVEVTRRRRHNELWLLAGYALIGGIAYAASLFSNTVGVTIFVLELPALIWWWFPARDKFLQVESKDTQLEGVIDRMEGRKVFAFLEQLTEVKVDALDRYAGFQANNRRDR